MEATGHEAEAKFQKKTQQYQVHPTLARPGTRQAAVLNSLNSTDAKRGYRHAIDEFVDWYCSEPRLAFNRIVVLRYRSHLETRQLAPARSICILALCAGSHMKRPTTVYSAAIWLPVFVASKV